MLKIGDKMPEFKALGAFGVWRTNYDFADKSALAIVFTGNTCKYAKAYAHRLIALFEKYNDDNLGIIGINSNDETQCAEDSYEGVKKTAYKLGLDKLNFVYCKDEDQSIAKAFGARNTPEVFLFNSKRELVYKGAIDDNWENEHLVSRVYFEDAIEYCLDGIEVDFPEVPSVQSCPILWRKGNEPEYVK